MLALTEGPIDDVPLRRAVETPGAGAVLVFHGTVRDTTSARRVTHLEYEAFPAMALRELRRIGDEVAVAHGLLRVACAHRLGRLEVGETAVVVAVSAPHRAAALAGIDDFLVRMKRDVPIWKKEHFEGGAVWVGASDGAPEARPAGRSP